MKIAIEGCCHGELDKIYETIEYLEKVDNTKVDLLLICGDFQAVRNRSDLQAMAVPPKYQQMNTFYKYYNGEKKAPILTVFIGGNHEASNYLQELPYGGWVAPNIYYMGYASIVQFGGLRIGGLSGIFKGRHMSLGHFERPPYTEDSKRSAYHVRNLEVFRIKQLTRPVDIFLSHDWPRGVHAYGNEAQLLRRKPFFRDDVANGCLGSTPAAEILFKLKPTYWFSAHLHCKFAAVVEHQLNDGSTKTTKFLALDKCLPKRNFLQVIDVPHEAGKELKLEVDLEWLTILKNTNHLLNIKRGSSYMPGPGPGHQDRYDFTVTDEEMKSLKEDFGGILQIPENFEQTAPTYTPAKGKKDKAPPPQMHINPQTTLLCEVMGLTDPFAVFCGKQEHSNIDVSLLEASTNSPNHDEDEGIPDDSDFIDSTLDMSGINSTLDTTQNPDEISLDDDNSNSDEAENVKSRLLAAPLYKSTPTRMAHKAGNENETRPSPTGTAPHKFILDVSLVEGDTALDSTCASLNIDSEQSLDDLDEEVEGKDLKMPVKRKSSEGIKESTDGAVDYGWSSEVPSTPSASSSATESGAESGLRMPKKFKRRNQSLYTSTDENTS